MIRTISWTQITTLQKINYTEQLQDKNFNRYSIEKNIRKWFPGLISIRINYKKLFFYLLLKVLIQREEEEANQNHSSDNINN